MKTLLLLIIILLQACTTAVVQQPRYTKQHAYVYTQIEIQKLLASPASAIFPPMGDDEIDMLNNSTYIISSCVDAENLTGVSLRIHFKCTTVFINEYNVITNNLKLFAQN